MDVNMKSSDRVFLNDNKAKYLNKMKKSSYLLPDPGGEVVRECIAKIESLEIENNHLRQKNSDLEKSVKELLTSIEYGSPNDAVCVRAESVLEENKKFASAPEYPKSSGFYGQY